MSTVSFSSGPGIDDYQIAPVTEEAPKEEAAVPTEASEVAEPVTEPPAKVEEVVPEQAKE